jgi:hypothetical protein
VQLTASARCCLSRGVRCQEVTDCGRPALDMPAMPRRLDIAWGGAASPAGLEQQSGTCWRWIPAVLAVLRTRHLALAGSTLHEYVFIRHAGASVRSNLYLLVCRRPILVAHFSDRAVLHRVSRYSSSLQAAAPPKSRILWMRTTLCGPPWTPSSGCDTRPLSDMLRPHVQCGAKCGLWKQAAICLGGML